MKKPVEYRRLLAIAVAIGVAILTSIPSLRAHGQAPELSTPNEKDGQPSQELRFRGQIVCLAEEMQRLYKAQLPNPHDHLYGFKTTDGKFYTLLRTRTSEAFFSDKRLHERELIVQGRVLPNTQILDAIPVGSVHKGKVHDLYYWCTVCAIRTPIPGECMCCQQPVEFVEKPLDR